MLGDSLCWPASCVFLCVCCPPVVTLLIPAPICLLCVCAVLRALSTMISPTISRAQALSLTRIFRSLPVYFYKCNTGSHKHTHTHSSRCRTMKRPPCSRVQIFSRCGCSTPPMSTTSRSPFTLARNSLTPGCVVIPFSHKFVLRLSSFEF